MNPGQGGYDQGQGGYAPNPNDSVHVQGQSWRVPPGGSIPDSEAAPPSNGDGSAPMPPPPSASESLKGRARIVFRVEPGDAAVYLNDHFVGTGEELSTLTRGLQVQPGQHTITISRPGMATQERTVVVGPGKSESVEVTLHP
jgi:hypothetical protein